MYFHLNILILQISILFAKHKRGEALLWAELLNGLSTKSQISVLKHAVNTVCSWISSSPCTCDRLPRGGENSPTHCMFLLREDLVTNILNYIIVLTRPVAVGWLFGGRLQPRCTRRSEAEELFFQHRHLSSAKPTTQQETASRFGSTEPGPVQLVTTRRSGRGWG